MIPFTLAGSKGQMTTIKSITFFLYLNRKYKISMNNVAIENRAARCQRTSLIFKDPCVCQGKYQRRKKLPKNQGF